MLHVKVRDRLNAKKIVKINEKNIIFFLLNLSRFSTAPTGWWAGSGARRWR